MKECRNLPQCLIALTIITALSMKATLIIQVLIHGGVVICGDKRGVDGETHEAIDTLTKVKKLGGACGYLSWR